MSVYWTNSNQKIISRYCILYYKMKYIFVSEEFLHLRSWKDNKIPVEICKSTARHRMFGRLWNIFESCGRAIQCRSYCFHSILYLYNQYRRETTFREIEILLHTLYNILLQYRHTRRLTFLFYCILNLERNFCLEFLLSIVYYSQFRINTIQTTRLKTHSKYNINIIYEFMQ